MDISVPAWTQDDLVTSIDRAVPNHSMFETSLMLSNNLGALWEDDWAVAHVCFRSFKDDFPTQMGFPSMENLQNGWFIMGNSFWNGWFRGTRPPFQKPPMCCSTLPCLMFSQGDLQLVDEPFLRSRPVEQGTDVLWRCGVHRWLGAS